MVVKRCPLLFCPPLTPGGPPAILRPMVPAAAHDVDTDQLARQLWAVGDATRLRLLHLLPTEADCAGGYNVSALAERLGLAQPTVSHHLRVLRQAGIIQSTRMCRDIYYYVDQAEVARVLDNLRAVLLEQQTAARP